MIVVRESRRSRLRWILNGALLALPAVVLLCGGLPSERTLVRQFESRRPILDTLRVMSDQDSAFIRISPELVIGSTKATSESLSKERMQRYAVLLRRAGSEAGIARRGGVVEIIVGSVGLGVSGASNGYAYFPTPPPHEQILSRLAEGHAGATFYRHLDGGWYLFQDR